MSTRRLESRIYQCPFVPREVISEDSWNLTSSKKKKQILRVKVYLLGRVGRGEIISGKEEARSMVAKPTFN